MADRQPGDTTRFAGDLSSTEIPGPEDRILLEGLTFYGYHGVNPEERVLGQRFVVDVTLSLDLRPAGQSDDPAKTINYATLYEIARRVVEGPRCSLIETLAERLATAILTEAGGTAVRVRVSKPWAPIKGGHVGNVAVEVYRRAEETNQEKALRRPWLPLTSRDQNG